MEPGERKETALPVIGGALNTICGVFGLIAGGILLIMRPIFSPEVFMPLGAPPISTELIETILVVSHIITLILGAIAIYGGICAIRREKFGWAIGGGICALLTFIFLGIPGLILVIIARGEFK